MKVNNRQEQEEEELAKKRMVRAGTGINYEQELNKDFVIRKKKKRYKKVGVVKMLCSFMTIFDNAPFIKPFLGIPLLLSVHL